MEFLLYFNMFGIIIFFSQTILRLCGDYHWFFHLADIFLLITFHSSILMIKRNKPKSASFMFFSYIFAILIFFVIGDLYRGIPINYSRLFYSAAVLSMGILINSIFSFNYLQVILFSLFSEIVLILHYILIISIGNVKFFNLNSFSYLLGGIMTIVVIGLISIMFLKLSHGIFTEIETDLQVVKKEQHDQLIIYNELLANMQTGLAYHQIITDSMKNPIDYVFLDINPAFSDLTGLQRNKVIGFPITKVFPAILKDPANWIEIYGSVALDQKNITFEQYFQELKKWFLITAYSPKKGYFVTIFTDISDRKKQEQEVIRQQKLTSISELAGGIAHDFNNLLVGILGNINLLQLSDSLSLEDKEILHDLELVAQRA